MACTQANSNEPADNSRLSPSNIINPEASTRLTRRRSAEEMQPNASEDAQTSEAASQSEVPPAQSMSAEMLPSNASEDAHTAQAASESEVPRAQSMSAEISADNIVGPLDAPRLTRQHSAVYVLAMRTTSTRQDARYNPATQAGRTCWKKTGARTTKKKVRFARRKMRRRSTDGREMEDDSDSDKENDAPSSSQDVQQRARMPLGELEISDFTAPSTENTDPEAAATTITMPPAPSRPPFTELRHLSQETPMVDPRSRPRTPPPAPRARGRVGPSPLRHELTTRSPSADPEPTFPGRMNANLIRSSVELADLLRQPPAPTESPAEEAAPTIPGSYAAEPERLHTLPNNPSLLQGETPIPTTPPSNPAETEISFPLPESADHPSLAVQPPSASDSPTSPPLNRSPGPRADPHGRWRERLFQSQGATNLEARSDRFGRYRDDGTRISNFQSQMMKEKELRRERRKEEESRRSATTLSNPEQQEAIANAVEDETRPCAPTSDRDSGRTATSDTGPERSSQLTETPSNAEVGSGSGEESAPESPYANQPIRPKLNKVTVGDREKYMS
ncbi:MAG: hypothetical protein Q9216_005920 [Gyalolechia sp. 2 TL-2023]